MRRSGFEPDSPNWAERYTPDYTTDAFYHKVSGSGFDTNTETGSRWLLDNSRIGELPDIAIYYIIIVLLFLFFVLLFLL